MVGYAAPERRGRFGRADVEAAVELEGITVDDLAQKLFGNAESEFGFAGAGGTDDGDQGLHVQ